MEVISLDFHFCYKSNSNLLSIKKQTNGNIIHHDMKIEMLFHVIQHYYYCGEHIWIYYMSHFHIGHFTFEICNEMWTSWNIEFEYKKCKTIWFTKCIQKINYNQFNHIKTCVTCRSNINVDKYQLYKKVKVFNILIQNHFNFIQN
jgi:hypothetical protein